MKVYTYTGIADLRLNSFYAEIRRLPHITATTDLALAMRRKFPDFPQVYAMDEIQQQLFPDWQSSEESFREYIDVGNSLRELEDQYPEELVHGFSKNKKDILNTIRFLIAADAQPDDLAADTKELELFRSLWVRFEAELDRNSGFQTELHVMEQNPEVFLQLAEKQGIVLHGPAVVLHGFFYITPLQQRMIDMLERAGKELIWLCCMDPEVQNVQEIWHRSLDTALEGKIQTMTAGGTDAQKNRAFGLLMDGQSLRGTESYANIKLIPYRTELDFVRDVQRIREEGLQLFSADTAETEELLKLFYPDSFRKRHLLSYPVGQFVYRLYSMWNDAKKRIEIQYDDLHVCFASGWLEANGKNGKDVLGELEMLRPYFARCLTPEEWRERLEQLEDAKRAVKEAFESYLEDVPKEHAAEHRLMGQPFDNLSCFSIEESALHTVKNMILRLADTAESLFCTKSGINAAQHMRKLRSLLSRKPAGGLQAAEQAVVDELLHRLDFNRLDSITCSAGELAEAVMLIVGSGILDEESLAFEDKTNETFIRHITKIESMPLRSANGIHLCLADENRMPGGAGKQNWPLSDDILEKMEMHADGRRKIYLRQMRMMCTDAPLIKKYLFYSLLQNERVEISWIEEDADGTRIGPSPYIQILENSFGVKRSGGNSCKKYVLPPSKEEQIKQNIPLLNAGVMLSKERQFDYALCRWRYLYSYILKDHPYFSSAFHYSFALSRLTGTLAAVTGVNRKTISEELFQLLPIYCSVEQRQILDYAGGKQEEAPDALDGILYPAERLAIHYLTSSMEVHASFLAARLQNGSSSMLAMDEPGIDFPDFACMYCPSGDTCPHAKRAGDSV